MFKPARLIQSVSNYVESLCEINYGSSPVVHLNGNVDTAIPYIPVHIEYIIMELIKNAMRATVEHSHRINRIEHPEIEVTIANSDQDITIRIRDEGGGISNEGTNYFLYNFIV